MLVEFYKFLMTIWANVHTLLSTFPLTHSYCEFIFCVDRKDYNNRKLNQFRFIFVMQNVNELDFSYLS